MTQSVQYVFENHFSGYPSKLEICELVLHPVETSNNSDINAQADYLFIKLQRNSEHYSGCHRKKSAWLCGSLKYPLNIKCRIGRVPTIMSF